MSSSSMTTGAGVMVSMFSKSPPGDARSIGIGFGRMLCPSSGTSYMMHVGGHWSILVDQARDVIAEC
jgi:hypothetical protein